MREDYFKQYICIPNMIVVPESSFVNFMTLAESVALAPIIGFSTSLVRSSVLEVDDFDLLRIVLFFII